MEIIDALFVTLGLDPTAFKKGTKEVDQALAHATERLKRDFTDEALEEQQRLIGAQQTLRERLAQLAGTD